MRVGFVGLGTMGGPMARRVLAAAHELVCTSRTPASAEHLAELGASVVATAAEVTERSKVVVLSLPDDAIVTAVVESLLECVAGRVVVDTSTISPQSAVKLNRRVEAAGGQYLDAPVSGGPYGAAAGTLTVMVGGAAEALDTALSALHSFAAMIYHVGPAGAGQVVKLANQLVVGAQVLAMSEAAVLVERSGVDPAALHRVLIASTADCHMARTRFPVAGVIDSSPATNSWRPDFTTRLMAKDLDIALSHAGAVGAPVLSTGIVRALLAASSYAGNDDLDFSSFYEVLRGGPD